MTVHAPLRKAFAPLALALLLGACSVAPPRGGGYYEDDGPPRRTPADLAAIPDAVPRAEPFSRYGNRPYKVFNQTYRPLASHKGYRERGVASWYGKKFHGRKTSSGEPYDMYAMSAAHKTLPVPCYVRVRNLQNGRSVVVRVNDRGPFKHNRLIDLSYAAATRLGITASGTGLVEVEAIDVGGPARTETTAAAPSANPQVFVQVGAFAEAGNAERLRDALRQAGFDSAHVSRHQDRQVLHRVRIGPLASVAESDDIIDRAARKGFANASLAID